MDRQRHHTEQELITLLQSGSQYAFECLFHTYSQKLYQFTVSYLKNETEAEEIVQEVFIKIWEKRERIKNDTSFKSYLFTIAFNSIRKHFNAKSKIDKYQTEILELISIENSAVESKINFELLLAKMDQLIDQMPERRREIFIKRKKEGKSIREIANELFISTKTVENQITEAMNFLRKEFAKDKISGLLFLHVFFWNPIN